MDPGRGEAVVGVGRQRGEEGGVGVEEEVEEEGLGDLLAAS